MWLVLNGGGGGVGGVARAKWRAKRMVEVALAAFETRDFELIDRQLGQVDWQGFDKVGRKGGKI